MRLKITPTRLTNWRRTVCACMCAGEMSAMNFLAVIRFKFVSKASSSCHKCSTLSNGIWQNDGKVCCGHACFAVLPMSLSPVNRSHKMDRMWMSGAPLPTEETEYNHSKPLRYPLSWPPWFGVTFVRKRFQHYFVWEFNELQAWVFRKKEANFKRTSHKSDKNSKVKFSRIFWINLGPCQTWTRLFGLSLWASMSAVNICVNPRQ